MDSNLNGQSLSGLLAETNHPDQSDGSQLKPRSKKSEKIFSAKYYIYAECAGLKDAECHFLCFSVSFFLLSYLALWSWEERVFGPAGDEQISGLASAQCTGSTLHVNMSKSVQVYYDIHHLSDIRTHT